MAVMHMAGSRSVSVGPYLREYLYSGAWSTSFISPSRTGVDMPVTHIPFICLTVICQFLCLAIYFNMHLMRWYISLFNLRMLAMSYFIFHFLPHLKDLMISKIMAMDAIHTLTGLI